jgi:hypothetical protein
MKNIYWSHIKMMRECPQKFLWTKGHPQHDLGNGHGNPKSLPPEEDRKSEHHLLMGSVLASVSEDFYKHELWRKGFDKPLALELEEKVRKEFVFQEQKRYCLWNYMTREDCIELCVSGIQNFLQIVHENKFLGRSNHPEYRMTPSVNKYFNACGIADLVYRDRQDKIHILDGKNATTPGKYEDPDQLRWYALCFRLQHNQLPESVGFYYFRYPSDNPPSELKFVDEKYRENWTGYVEVPIEATDIKRLANEAIQTSKAINRGVFEPNPIPKHCSMCNFESVCEERQAQKSRNAAKRGLRRAKVPNPVEGADGFLEFSMGKKDNL